MATKTFSGRVDPKKLEYADAKQRTQADPYSTMRLLSRIHA